MQKLKKCCTLNWRAPVGLALAFLLCSLIVGCGSTGVSTPGSGGSGGTLTANQITVQFGNIPVNATVPPQVLTFTNPLSSAKPVTISQVQFGGTNATSFSLAQTPTLPLVVNPGQSVSATIQVSAASAGALTATLTVTSDATPSTLVINLGATGVTPVSGQAPISISGTVTPITQATGATVNVSGPSGIPTPLPVTVDSNGNYTLFVFANGTYTVTPTDTGIFFNPLSQPVTVAGTSQPNINFAASTNAPSPSVSSLSPSSLPAGSAGQALTVNGSNFLSTVTATYNGVAHTVTFVSNSQVTIQLGAADLATPGAFPVIVTNPAPGGGASNSVNFTVANPTPAVSSLSPSSAIAGSPATTLTVSGSGFVSNSAVTYNGVAHAATFANSGQLTIQLSTTDLATAGTFQVIVTNPAPGGGSSGAVNFTVTASQVSITPSSFTFANVPIGTTSAPQTGTLSATGGSVPVTADTLTGAGFGLSGITFPVTIPAGQSVSFSVTFTPSSTGTTTGSVAFANNGTNLALPATLSGTGAGLTLSPANLTFPSPVPDGTSSAQSTAGTLTAVGTNVTINSAPITQSGGGGSAFSVSGLPAFPFTINAGSSQTFNVTFAPAAGSPGLASGTITFMTGANNVAQTVSGTGARNVLLTWGASSTSGVTYNVYRCSGTCTSALTNFNQIATGIGALTYTDADAALVSGQTYVYAVTAVAAGAESTPAVSNGATVP